MKESYYETDTTFWQDTTNKSVEWNGRVEVFLFYIFLNGVLTKMLLSMYKDYAQKQLLLSGIQVHYIGCKVP